MALDCTCCLARRALLVRHAQQVHRHPLNSEAEGEKSRREVEELRGRCINAKWIVRESAKSTSHRRASYGVNSEVRIAPLRHGSTSEIFNTFRLPLSIQTVCLSASLSAATISSLYASNVPAGTLTLSVPTTFNCLICGFCFITSKFRKLKL